MTSIKHRVVYSDVRIVLFGVNIELNLLDRKHTSTFVSDNNNNNNTHTNTHTHTHTQTSADINISKGYVT